MVREKNPYGEDELFFAFFICGKNPFRQKEAAITSGMKKNEEENNIIK